MSEEIKKNTVDIQTATEEFNRFCEDWEIDFDESEMNAEEKVDFQSIKNKILKAIQKGRLVFDSGVLIYTISRTEKHKGEQVHIRRPHGAAYMEMDRYKDQEGVHKIYAVLAAMTGKESSFFANMDGIDIKPFQSIVSLFLAD